jgi:CRP-like cAMP-binding protein
VRSWHQAGLLPSPFDIFQWLPADVAERLTSLGRRRSYSAGQIIYCQDDPSNELYRIVSGTVRLALIREDGKEFVFGVFGPGECFGEGGLIDGLSRPNTARAHEGLEMEIYPAAVIAAVRADHRELDDALLQLLARRMRMLCDYCAVASLDDLAQRLAVRILFEADVFCLNAPSALPPLVLPLPQGDLASMLGASRQSVNRVLQKMQDLGALELSYGRIVLHDMNIIRGLAALGS